MKKVLFSILALVLALGLGLPVAAHTESDPQIKILYAGQDIPVGTVNVWNDGTDLYVTYEITEPGWLLVETHLEVVEDDEDFPITKKGNPKVGHFTWSETHDPPVDTYTYTIALDDIGDGVVSSDDVVIAAHAEVVFLDETRIDFEAYSEFDKVGLMSTPNGDVNFYMTNYTTLAALNIGDYAALTSSGDSPVVASPGTNTNPPVTYSEIVAFTVGGPPYADDVVVDDNGTGAGGNTLTDPQDKSQTELMWHAYSQFLGIVIDVSALDWVEDMGLVTIDLDHGELWHFLYFDAAGTLLHKDTIGPGTSGGDGKAFPISWTDDEYSIAKVVVFGEMNNNDAGIVGYAIDNICITSAVQEETAWAAALGEPGTISFPGKNWATYFEYTVQGILTGTWRLDVNSGAYMHDMFIVSQDSTGALTGTGGYPESGPPYNSWYYWTLTGQLTGNSISLVISYTNGYTTTLTGTVDPSWNSMNGTGTAGVNTWVAKRLP